MTQPTVYIVIKHSAIAFEEETGEMLETVEWDAEGVPDWSYAGICDHRGSASEEGYQLLRIALIAAEANARACGIEIKRAPRP